jgi:hypothetical protein
VCRGRRPFCAESWLATTSIGRCGSLELSFVSQFRLLLLPCLFLASTHRRSAWVVALALFMPNCKLQGTDARMHAGSFELAATCLQVCGVVVSCRRGRLSLSLCSGRACKAATRTYGEIVHMHAGEERHRSISFDLYTCLQLLVGRGRTHLGLVAFQRPPHKRTA